MGDRKSGVTRPPAHRFGGGWTESKLAIVQSYLRAYAIALKEKRFQIAYIDAFAGTGYRSEKEEGPETGLLFPDLAADAPQEFLEGSARLALQVDPSFDKYLFIEKDPARCRVLETLKQEFPDRSARVQVREGDANKVLQEICGKPGWENLRAVLFLDPYGMQVEWDTIEAIANTGAIDLWLLFPLGMGLSRLLPRSGNIPDGWRRRLDLFLGTTDWQQALYSERPRRSLFDDDAVEKVRASTGEVGRYFVDRLRTVFPAVSDSPRVLENSSRCPLYLLCFAVSSRNPQAQRIALRIADHILRSD
ncbi:MAG: three-Cys-motif partner protein TcmP [Thermoanaerobaculia bacterium]